MMWSRRLLCVFSLLWLILDDLCSLIHSHVRRRSWSSSSLLWIWAVRSYAGQTGSTVLGQIWMTIAWNNWRSCVHPGAFDFDYRKSGEGAESIEVRSHVDSIRVKPKKESLNFQIGTYRFQRSVFLHYYFIVLSSHIHVTRAACFPPPVVVALAPSHFVIRLGLVCLVCLRRGTRMMWLH